MEDSATVWHNRNVMEKALNGLEPGDRYCEGRWPSLLPLSPPPLPLPLLRPIPPATMHAHHFFPSFPFTDLHSRTLPLLLYSCARIRLYSRMCGEHRFVLPRGTYHVMGGLTVVDIHDVVIQIDGTLMFSDLINEWPRSRHRKKYPTGKVTKWA